MIEFLKWRWYLCELFIYGIKKKGVHFSWSVVEIQIWYELQKTTKKVYMPKFNFPVQFGMEISVEKTRSTIELKSRFRTTIECTCQISISHVNLKVKYAWKSLFSRSKSENIINSPLLIDVGSWFSDMLYHFELSIDWLKQEQFLKF